MQRKAIAICCAAVLGLSCVSELPASAEEQDPVEDIPVPMSVDPVEPGSPEAFFTWVTSTLELIDDSLSSSSLGGWGLSTVEYAMEMRSLMIAYQVWLDNDTLQANMVVPSWASVSGFCRVSDSGVPNGYSLHRVTATYAINGSSDTVAMYHMPGGISVFSSDIGFARTLNTGVETEHRSFLPYAALSDPWIDGAQRHALTVVMLGFVASTIDTTPFMQVGNNYSIDFFDWADIPSHWVYLRGNGLSSFACQSGSPIPQSILGDNVKVPIEIRTNDDLPRLFDEINEEYPDHEDIFPDMIPPKHNYEYDESIEDTSHPCGCQCEIHVHVTVDNNLDGLLSGGSPLNSGVVDDLGIDPDAAFQALDELSLDALETESMQAGLGLIWALFSKITETTGIMPFIMICMLIMLLIWFFGRSL